MSNLAHKIDSQQVEDAYQAYAALQRCLRDNPGLRSNEYFKALKDTAFARFQLALEAL